MLPGRAAVLCALLACSCLVHLTAAQFGMPGMGGPEPPKAAAVKSDVQYIKCQTCEALVKQAYRHTKSKREGLKPGHKVRGDRWPAAWASGCQHKLQGWGAVVSPVPQVTHLAELAAVLLHPALTSLPACLPVCPAA